MSAGDFLFYNGKIVPSGKALISADNRSFRYGDGCFETIKMVKGRIPLRGYHFERLLSSLELLRFHKPDYFNADYLEKKIREVAEKNGHRQTTRVRVMVFRGSGGVYDPENHFPNHIIQTWGLLPGVDHFNENGLVINIFMDARKVCDRFSPVKHNNYLPYLMAALWAKEQHLDDALLLNPSDRIADATIANLFIVKDGIIKTPALSEGPVNGVMRRHLLQCMRKENMPVEETAITVEDVLQASEVFLTNAVQGIKWVKQVGESAYTHSLSELLHQKFIEPL